MKASQTEGSSQFTTKPVVNAGDSPSHDPEGDFLGTFRIRMRKPFANRVVSETPES